MSSVTETHSYHVNVFVQTRNELKGPLLFKTSSTTRNDKGMVGVIIGNVAKKGDMVFLRLGKKRRLEDKSLYKEIVSSTSVELDFTVLSSKDTYIQTQEEIKEIAKGILAVNQKGFFVDKV